MKSFTIESFKFLTKNEIRMRVIFRYNLNNNNIEIIIRQSSIKYDKLNSLKTRRRNGQKPMTENKNCSAYLGVVISEQILSKVFEDVQVMPYGNKGYDFICNHGKKIDVKSSCQFEHKNNNHSKSWNFNINKNTIPDYFLCLAFDNREDLNPLHIWLIPRSLIYDKISAKISESTINKWDEHRLDVNEIIKYCDIMRGK